MLGYALLGLIVGALLNHAANTLPYRQSPSQPPKCPFCGQDYSPLEWIAVVSYLAGRRQCSHCGAPLSYRAPLVELFTALAFAYLWRRFGPSTQLALFTLYAIVFILVFVIDLEHRLILNVVMYPAILLAVLASFFRPDLNYRLALLGGATGFLLVLLIYLGGPLFVRLWSRLRGEDTAEVPFGFGDVTLSTFIGLVVGFPGIIFALFIGILLGGIGAIVVILSRLVLRKGYVSLMAIPYGPFLIAGGALMLLYGPRIMSAYLSAYS